jgi:threonine dehydratase
VRSLPAAALAGGVATASAGNMGQGLAWVARTLGIPCTVVVPEHAPRAKLDALERLGAALVPVPFAEWWDTLERHGRPGLPGHFVHPVSDVTVMAGNGTIGLEILEDLPDVDTVLVPYGGGGLSCGIAAAVRALRPEARVIACEVESAAPLSASLAAGAPATIEHRRSFVDGIGGRGVLPEMWPLAKALLHGARVASLRDVADAIRLLVARARVVAEGAGATPVAVALSGAAGVGRIACVVSGGNLDPGVLARILEGEVPG